MTREEAKQMFRDDKNSQGCYKAVLTKIDKIYDAFEEQMRQGQLLPIDSVMQSIEELRLIEEIKNCEKNIESAKEVLENVKKKLYEEEQFLIMYKNRLDKIKNVK